MEKRLFRKQLIAVQLCSSAHPCSTMDSVQPCEGFDSGSTPDEDTKLV